MHILIVFGSKEGQTEKIAQRMLEIIRSKGYQVTAYSGKELKPGFTTEHYDAAIIGGSIHMGHHPAYLKTFVTDHHDWLNDVPSAFFTVCMGINSQEENSRVEASHYGERFLKEVNWQPQLVATFAGAVKYTQYNVITRLIMKRISRKEGGSTDTSHDHEYTDWGAVERFTDQFLEQALESEAI